MKSAEISLSLKGEYLKGLYLKGNYLKETIWRIWFVICRKSIKCLWWVCCITDELENERVYTQLFGNGQNCWKQGQWGLVKILIMKSLVVWRTHLDWQAHIEHLRTSCTDRNIGTGKGIGYGKFSHINWRRTISSWTNAEKQCSNRRSLCNEDGGMGTSRCCEKKQRRWSAVCGETCMHGAERGKNRKFLQRFTYRYNKLCRLYGIWLDIHLAEVI